jgi:hypothetical protein
VAPVAPAARIGPRRAGARAGLPRAGLPLAAAALLAACAAQVPPVPLESFVNGELEPVRAFFDRELAGGDENSAALFLNGLAQVELYSGEPEPARRHFEQAARIMGNWSTGGTEVTAAIVGAESSKTWQGDPHEKAMNAFYGGLLYWWAGEPDNGRAAFRRGILADAESDEGGHQADCALLFWLAGRASLAMGLPADAEDYFAEARAARDFAVAHGARGASSAPLLTDPSRGNLIVLAELGLGPRKVAGGPQGSLAVILPREVQVAWAEVFVDGVPADRTTLLADLDYQARTRGGRAMAGIREGKAVLKTAAGIAGTVLVFEGLGDRGSGRGEQLLAGGILLLASMLISAEADTRHWETLPQTVQALAVEVPPGRHEVRIEFHRPGGARVPSMSQTRTVEIQDGRQAVELFRSIPPPRPRAPEPAGPENEP